MIPLTPTSLGVPVHTPAPLSANMFTLCVCVFSQWDTADAEIKNSAGDVGLPGKGTLFTPPQKKSKTEMTASVQENKPTHIRG